MRRAGRFRKCGAVGACALLAACGGDYSALAPAGPAADAVATLWWIMLAGAVLIFAATSLVLAGAWSPRMRGALTPRRLIVWGGLVVPSIVLTLLVVAAFVLGERLLPRGDAPLRIEVTAQRFAWRFGYPGGGTTFDVLHLPAGTDVELAVTSEDVIHSFWIPRLGGKIDAIPGHRNLIRLSADRPGTYGGICAEFCGEGHAVMRFEAIAHAPEDYDAALADATEQGR